MYVILQQQFLSLRIYNVLLFLFSCAPSWKRQSDVGYNLFLFIIGFFCPLTVIILSSISILRTIKKVCDAHRIDKIKTSCFQAKSFITVDEIQIKMSRKQLKVFYLVRNYAIFNEKFAKHLQVSFLIFSFILCWSPYAVFSLCGIFGLTKVNVMI